MIYCQVTEGSLLARECNHESTNYSSKTCYSCSPAIGKTIFYSRKLIQKYEMSAVTFLLCVLAEVVVKEVFALLGCNGVLIGS